MGYKVGQELVLATPGDSFYQVRSRTVSVSAHTRLPCICCAARERSGVLLYARQSWAEPWGYYCWLPRLRLAYFHERRSIDGKKGEEVLSTLRALLQILEKLVGDHLHRLYIVDDATRPVGVVTLTDILHVVTNQSH